MTHGMILTESNPSL